MTRLEGKIRGTNPARRNTSGFSPYRAKDSEESIRDVLARTNLAVYNAHGPDYRLSGEAPRIVVDPAFHYEPLLRCIAESAVIDCMPFCELLRAPKPNDRIVCGIRHDVDIDIRAAVTQAEIEAEYGIRTSYYILHTAPYYGSFKSGVFYRHSRMAHLYRRIQDLGHEIALHTDPFLVYQRFGIDGAAALRQEIEWLRGEGIDIVGTTAHGSAAVYGVESFAIFKGRSHKLPKVLGGASNDDRTNGAVSEYEHDGKVIPLGVLDEAELGLDYEANEVFWQNDTPVEYGALRGANAWRWNRHLRRKESKKASMERRFYDQDRLLRDIASTDPGCFLILVVHPVYYGARHSSESGPPRRMDRRSTTVNDHFGWDTYEPYAIQARSGEAGQRQEFQAINMSNGLGMLDRPHLGQTQSNEFRVLVLGGTNVDGSSTTIEAQMHVILRELIEARIERPTKTFKLAFPGMGLTRHYGWYKAVAGEVRPHAVVIGIGADEIGLSLPEGWASMTGFRPAFPPADYLHWSGAAVEVVKASKHALAHRRKPNETNTWPSLAQAEAHWPNPRAAKRSKSYLVECLKFFAETIRKDGATPIVLVQETGEGIGLWASDVSNEARKDGHGRFMAFVREAAGAGHMPVIDPYRLFIQQAPGLPAHWRSTPEWNYTGHRLAAEEACRTMMATCFEKSSPVR